MDLSGGMKRRVMIAKALSHEPDILFLDEPTAGVDVELRRDMWNLVRGLRERGVTIILTTHYIEEAEEMADRVGVINKGSLILVEEKATLMRKFGKKRLTLHLRSPLSRIPPKLAPWNLALEHDGLSLECTFDSGSDAGISVAPATDERAVDPHQGPRNPSELPRGDFREPGERPVAGRTRMSRPALRFEFNGYGVWAIYKFEIAARAAHPRPKPRDSRHHDLALLRGVRRGDRIRA